MSLQVWLTGNNSMNNQGLLGELTQTTAPTYVDGKLGKAISTGGYKMTAEQTAQVLNNEAISICFWVYINADTGTTNNRVMFFGNDDMGSNNNRKFSLFNYPTVNDLHWYWMNDETNATVGLLSGILPSYQWTHVAVTYQNPNGTVYINGKKVDTFTGISNSSTFAYETQVIHNSTYLHWNDYRIYDHCLSAKEVREISKGLVCHYQLKSQYETGQVNKYSGDVAEGYLTGSFTRTKLEGERGYNYKLTYTGTGNNDWHNMNAGSTFSFTAGKKYYYSCKVRCHSTNFVLALRASRSGNDWVTNMTNVLNPDGEWHEYVVYQTINKTYDRGGSTVTCDPILEFYTESLVTSGKVYSADFDIKDVQVIESNYYVPFIDNDMVSNVISDCSGYGNNGTKVGDIAWSGDSARYSGSYIPTTNSSYISTTLNTPGYANSYTISYWAKISDMDGKMVFGFSDGNRLNVYPTNSVFCWNTGDSGDNPFQNNGTNVTYTSYNGAWHHYVITGNGNTTTLYIDGEKKGTARAYKAITGTKLFLSGWDTGTSYKWTGGNISDFRLYSTCFSDSDVKALYNVSASIDKTGVLSAYEFVEEG